MGPGSEAFNYQAEYLKLLTARYPQVRTYEVLNEPNEVYFFAPQHGPNGEIQFEKDREAAREYFLQHVNQNTVFFHYLKERLDYLVE